MTEQYDTRQSLDSQIADARDEVATVGDAQQPAALSELATLLYQRYLVTDSSENLNEAIQYFELAEATADESNQNVYAFNLAAVLFARYQSSGRRDDLDRAVAYATESAELANTSELHNASLIGLAALLYARWSATGQIEDLNQSIAMLENADRAAYSVDSRALILANLGIAYRDRYSQTRDVVALERSIECARLAVGATSANDGHARLARNLVLASSLEMKFDATNQLSLLEEAIDTLRSAIELVAEDDAAPLLTALGNALQRRFQVTRKPNDLLDSISAHRAAIRTTSTTDPGLGEQLDSLSRALTIGFETTRNNEYIDEAIHIGRQIVSFTRENREHDEAMARLGLLLSIRAQQNIEPSTHAREAIGVLLLVVHSQVLDVKLRLNSARIGAQLSATEDDWISASQFCQSAIENSGLRGSVAWQYTLSQWPTLASDAITSELETGNVTRAVGLLESGWPALATDVLEIRRAASSLAISHPHLHDRLSSHRWVNALSTAQSEPGQAAAERDWSELVEEIRAVPGHYNFLRPLAKDIPIRLSAGQAVVAVNVSRYRSHVVMLDHSGAPLAIFNLPHLKFDECTEIAENYTRRVLRGVPPGSQFASGIREIEQTLTDTLHWLWRIAGETIAEHLQRFGVRHAIWAIGGPLSRLPMHAAGPTADGSSSLGMIDQVTSSYIPSIRYAMDSAGIDADLSTGVRHTGHPLAVLSSLIPASDPLASVAMELSALNKAFEGTEVLQGSAVTASEVSSRLENASLVHFSGHGQWNRDDARSSGLVLSDGLLSATDILRFSGHKPKLAVLSASCTALDAAVNSVDRLSTASALLAIGLRDVVGTIVSVRDRDAANFTADFYRNLSTGQPVAVAVNSAVRSLAAKYSSTPTAWAGFVHLGRF